MARIMIVDDTKFIRMTLSTILQNLHHDIIAEAENGQEAVTLYLEHQPDLVFMDITMPVMSGIEAINKIMQHDQSAKIIVCSAMGQQKTVVQAIESGAKDFVVKPFDENRIKETVQRVLHHI
ncbi:response regulator [Virgibacillus soli]|uniref:Response regulator n=1 Tax=Paracerasibacillus soli TaxID=480284 RepID=A0ABU5CPF0_9BACI|nr:response regulator [Virgibacillus soli]MDY0408231.1 response regulator [Virgibacillus soli]